MKEDIISFDTAKLAKEKGFNYMKSNCFGDNMAYNLDDPTAIPACKANVAIGYILAPTQSLLQKWLWETHKIFVDVGPFHLFGGFGVEVYQPTKENPTGYLPIEGLKGETPQEGLELGLQEALKLIEV